MQIKILGEHVLQPIYFYWKCKYCEIKCNIFNTNDVLLKKCLSNEEKLIKNIIE